MIAINFERIAKGDCLKSLQMIVINIFIIIKNDGD